MKLLAFACCLLFLSGGLSASASAAQNEKQPPASGSTNVAVSAATDERADKKTVHRASRGPARPRLFWIRRASR